MTAAGRPVVSVVVPTYNSARFIRETLDSVFAQEGAHELDVIVVDDGSTDDTVARVSGGYPLRCVEQPNQGPAAARNVALGLARGEYIAFLDSDDLWPDGKLDRQVRLLEAHPDIGLVFGDCRQFDEDGPYAHTLFQGSGRGTDFWGDTLYVRKPYAKLMEGNFITTGSVVMRRECVERIGRFDERLRLVEDLEYWLRIALDLPVAHADEVCLLRRRHADNASRDQVAMSRAFLQVLDEHSRRHGRAIAAQGADVRRRMMREYQELGHLHMRKAAYGEAAGAYYRALSGRPSARSLYYWLTAVAHRLGAVRARASG